MSATDDILNAEANAGDFKLGDLPMKPARKLAILACMDARLTVEQVCGLKTGDAHIIRNAGGIATEDALRSLIISHHLVGTQEFIVINHTDCGMLSFKDEALRKHLEEKMARARMSWYTSTPSMTWRKMYEFRWSGLSRIPGFRGTFQSEVSSTTSRRDDCAK